MWFHMTSKDLCPHFDQLSLADKIAVVRIGAEINKKRSAVFWFTVIVSLMIVRWLTWGTFNT